MDLEEGINKAFKSKIGFQVDILFRQKYTDIGDCKDPGFYIRVFKPNKIMKEKKHFPLGEKQEALDYYDSWTCKLQEGDRSIS